MNLPKLFTGEKTAAAWGDRRKEILALLGQYEYGVTPEIKLDKVTYTTPFIMELAGNIQYETHRAFFKAGDEFCSMRFEIFSRQTDKPLPSILMIDVFDSSPDNMEYPDLSEKMQNRLPYDYITAQGYAAVLIHVNDICNDDPASFERGIMEIAPRDGESGWGAIGAWAWGTSRVVDYILQDDRFANDKIATIGVSRAGKTSVWCGAQDERIGAVISTVSGCGGASLLREKTGEHIRNMSKQFPHWTCDKYAEYAEKEDELPIDQHMLLALCAPRPLYLSDAIEDEWADPHKAFEAAQLASEVYEVYGKPGLKGDVFPEIHHPLTEGMIAYHVRTGGHGLSLYEWQQYIPFLNRCFSL